MAESRKRVIVSSKEESSAEHEELIGAFTTAINRSSIVTVQLRYGETRTLHPVKLNKTDETWQVHDAIRPEKPLSLEVIVSINISAHTFSSSPVE